MWVWKQDVGVESFTEKEKGQASDSFKRACFNWGIGRELYSAPFIWISADKCRLFNKNGKITCNDRFSVTYIGYDASGNIDSLSVKNDSTGKDVYTFGAFKLAVNTKKKTVQKDPVCTKLIAEITALMMSKGYPVTQKAAAQLDSMDVEALKETLSKTMALPDKTKGENK